jgi:hypothetical protein
VKRPIGSGRLNEVKRPIGSGRLSEVTKRRTLVLGVIAGVVALVVGLLVWHAGTKAPTDCDTVRDLVAYNREFTEQTKTSARTNNPDLSTAGQYGDWAAKIKDYAGRVKDPGLAGSARSAADLAAKTAALVPQYRAKPDDAEIRRQYANIGIEFGNAITTLNYACPAR